jgi:hypothetical protein
VQMQTDGSSSIRSAVTSLWGPKALNNTEDLDISFEVPPDKIAQQRLVALGEDLEFVFVLFAYIRTHLIIRLDCLR